MAPLDARPAIFEARSTFVEAHRVLDKAHPAFIDVDPAHVEARLALSNERLTTEDRLQASTVGRIAAVDEQLAFSDDHNGLVEPVAAPVDQQQMLADERASTARDEAASANLQTAARNEQTVPVDVRTASGEKHPALANNQSRFWNLPPAALGTAWRDEGFQLHSQPFLRIRTRSISTIEGINRAMLEFAIPTQSVDRIELWLEGRDSTEPLIDVLGYTGDGEVLVEDADRIGELIKTIQTPHLGLEVIDVTDFLASQSASGATHVGFRLQLVNEAQLPIGLNIRAEWRTDARLVVYPTCFADCDSASGSMVLDIFDFLCFQDSFIVTSPYACDCDTSTGTGVCDLFDFLCFQQAYLDGCSP